MTQTGKHHDKIKLIIYPGESRNSRGVIVGHIYVMNGHGESYQVAGGPPVPKGKGSDGHAAGPTPAHKYVLAAGEHHLTRNWPYSSVPFGAQLREEGDVIEYRSGGIWKPATGPKGSATEACLLAAHRMHVHVTVQQASDAARSIFFEDGKLMPEWTKNDFGRWSWNLKANGARTAYYLHTTPDDERSSASGVPFDLSQSHGCLHIRPSDRDEMMRKGYLRAGIEVEVKPYGQIGPPK